MKSRALLLLSLVAGLALIGCSSDSPSFANASSAGAGGGGTPTPTPTPPPPPPLPVVLVSINPAGTASGNGQSIDPRSSDDGRFVVFQSDATDLIAGDTNGFGDIYVRDITLGVTQRVSVATGGAQANALCRLADISDDGDVVVFQSPATTLVPAANNGQSHIFVHVRSTGVTSLVSKSPGGAAGDGASARARISGDGRYVVYDSTSSNLIGAGNDTNGLTDVFRYDRNTDTTIRISRTGAGAQITDNVSRFPTISDNGNLVLYTSLSTQIVAGVVSGLHGYVYDVTGDTVELVTRLTGAAGTIMNNPGFANFGRFEISGNGTVCYFTIDTDNSDPRVAALGTLHLYARNLTTDTTSLVLDDTAGGVVANGRAFTISVSDDGNRCAYESAATNLDPNHTSQDQVHLSDAGVADQVLQSVTADRMEASASSGTPGLSGDGSRVFFISSASNLLTLAIDGNGNKDIYTIPRQ